MSIAPVPLLTLAGLSDDEQGWVDRLTDQLVRYLIPNFEANAYYEAKHIADFPGFAIPGEVAEKIGSVTGAPGTVVDVLDERLDFLGWENTSGDDDAYDLRAVYDANELDSEGPSAHLDSLIFGTSFACAGAGDADQPLITLRSPLDTTGIRDPASRRLTAAWSTLPPPPEDSNAEARGVLDLPDETVTVEMREGRWRVIDRDEHKLGRVPVVEFTNRPRAARSGGRSEITRAIRSLTEEMLRARLGMNVNSMFYSIPQLMLLGRGPDAFKDRHGNPVDGWKVLAGHMLALKKDEDGDVPEVKQLTVASPQPFIDQLREYRTQIASEAGMPADYLGIQTANPTSADAIRAGENRLVKRTERRQSGFGRSWLEVARLALLIRDGAIPDDFNTSVYCEWQNAATPTAAATADEVTKLIGSGVLTADSEVARKRLGFSPAERRILEREQRRGAGQDALNALLNQGPAHEEDEQEPTAGQDNVSAVAE